MEQTEGSGEFEPTATIVISWIAIVPALAGLAMAASTRGKYHNIEDMGYAVLGIAGLALTLMTSAAGMLAAGIGMKRAKDRGVRVRSLTISFVVNLLLFWSVFLVFAATTQVKD